MRRVLPLFTVGRSVVRALAFFPRPFPGGIALDQPATDEVVDEPLDVELGIEQFRALETGVEFAEEKGLLVDLVFAFGRFGMPRLKLPVDLLRLRQA